MRISRLKVTLLSFILLTPLFVIPVKAANAVSDDALENLFLDYAQLYILTLNIVFIITSFFTITFLVILEFSKKKEWRNHIVPFVAVNSQALLLSGIVFIMFQLFTDGVTSWTDLDKLSAPLTWKLTYLYFLIGLILLVESFFRFKIIEKFRGVLRFYGATITISFMLFLSLYFIIL